VPRDRTLPELSDVTLVEVGREPRTEGSPDDFPEFAFDRGRARAAKLGGKSVAKTGDQRHFARSLSDWNHAISVNPF
jgi:hypothetical protein